MTARRAFLAGSLALAVLGTAVGVSWAAFTSTTSNGGSSFTADPDWVPPSASPSVVLRNGGSVPGYIRQGSGYRVYANVSDFGNPASGVSAVTANTTSFDTGVAAAALSAGSWTVQGQSYNYRSASLTANGTLAQNTYAYTHSLTDNAGNNQVQGGFSVVVDNTAPTGSDIQGAPGGTAGQIDAGDALIYTYSEPMDPTTILAGWDGSATSISVSISGGPNANVTTNVALGGVRLGRRAYGGGPGTTGATFSASMTMSGSAVTVTLTSQTSGGASQTMTASTMVWTPATAATDRAGNPASAAATTESGGSDADF